MDVTGYRKRGAGNRGRCKCPAAATVGGWPDTQVQRQGLEYCRWGWQRQPKSRTSFSANSFAYFACYSPLNSKQNTSRETTPCTNREPSRAKFRARSQGSPGGPVVKTLLSSAGGVGLIPVWELGSHMPVAKKAPKHKTEVML